MGEKANTRIYSLMTTLSTHSLAADMGFLVRCSLEVKAKSNNCCLSIKCYENQVALQENLIFSGSPSDN